jgi:hypothetical protein
MSLGNDKAFKEAHISWGHIDNVSGKLVEFWDALYTLHVEVKS